ncbi:MAG: zincin-like metallopeptidase domain-containing protein [Thiobacillus sp.]
MAIDLAQEVIATLAQQLERADTLGSWQKPWHAIGTDCLPIDPTSGREYEDDDDVSRLWDEQVIRGYATNFWTSRRRWRAGGGEVHRGERGTPLCPRATGEGRARRTRWVFNADQQAGYPLPHEQMRTPLFAPDARLDAWFAGRGIATAERGGSAFYSPKEDLIVMPDRRLFVGNDSITAGEAWYATRAHEHIHATGHRLGRDMGTLTGTPARAFEDLIAEIGAALLMAQLGMPIYRTAHHARFIALSQQLIRDKEQSFLAAASEAQKAVEWLRKESARHVSG